MKFKKILGLGTALTFSAISIGGAFAADAIITNDIRRVVMSERADGSSYIASDEVLLGSPMQGVGRLYTLWGNDATNTVPDDGKMPTFSELYPPVGGHRVYVAVYPPGTEVKPSADDLTGGDAKIDASDIPGMHKSDTTDFDIVLAGEVQSILSDGTIITLKAGDMMVLNGALHAWKNVSSEPAVVAFFMTGASR